MSKWKLCEVRMHNDWPAIFNSSKYNWVNFSLVHVEFDYDKYGPLYSFTFSLLGFTFYISFNPPYETEQSKEVAQRYDEYNNAKFLYKFVKTKNPKYKENRKSIKHKKIDNTMLD